MSGVTPSTPADPRHVRLFLRNTLEEACGRVLRRLREDVVFSPMGVETLQWRAGELLEAVHRLPVLRQPLVVALLLLQACSCSLLPPAVLQALVRRLLERLDQAHFQLVLGHLQQAVVRERRLEALLATRDGLSFALQQELAALLDAHCYLHLHLQRRYQVRLTTTTTSAQQHQTRRVDLAFAESTSGVGVYATVRCNPQDMRALRAGQAPLRDILAGERASAPGGTITGPRSRACRQLVFYSQGADDHQREAIDAHLSNYSAWEQADDLYEAAWGLPPRQVGASILPVCPATPESAGSSSAEK